MGAERKARSWLLDRKVTANNVGIGLIEDARAYLESLEPRALAEFLIGGLSVVDIPDEFSTSDYMELVREAHGVHEYLHPPIMDQVHAISIRPADNPSGIEKTLEKKPFVDF